MKVCIFSAYKLLNVKHEALQLITPQFETPLPLLQPAVSPSSSHQLSTHCPLTLFSLNLNSVHYYNVLWLLPAENALKCVCRWSVFDWGVVLCLGLSAGVQGPSPTHAWPFWPWRDLFFWESEAGSALKQMWVSTIGSECTEQFVTLSWAICNGCVVFSKVLMMILSFMYVSVGTS